MKRSPVSTLVVITASRVVRADWRRGAWTVQAGPRPATESGMGTGAESVAAALKLAGPAPGRTWVLSCEVFAQEVRLSPAQIAGLSPAQIERALAFEVEPFSGLSQAEGVLAFHEDAPGSFSIAALPQTERAAVVRAVRAAGGKLAGLTHGGRVPEAEAELAAWCAGKLARLESGALPVIMPAAPTPSRHRFLVAGLALEAAALLLLFAIVGRTAAQRRELETRNTQLASAAREIEAADRQVAALKMEAAALDREEEQRGRVIARRGSLLALLRGLAATRGEDVVVRGIQADGPSSLIVSGVSLEAGAVEEMSIVLTQSLRAAGWVAQPRNKTGIRHLPTGGPWEFSLTVTHDEAARKPHLQLTQRAAP